MYTDGGVGIYLINSDGTGNKKLTDGNYEVWSPSGTRIAFKNKNTYVINVDGTGMVEVPGVYQLDKVAWSPNEQQLVYRSYAEASSGNETSAGSDLYVINLDGTNKINLTNVPYRQGHGFGSFDPKWSPDGSKILFQQSPSGSSPADLYVVNSDGTGKVALTDTTDSYWNSEQEWSPDGSKIAYRGGQLDPIILINPDGTGKTTLTDGTNGGPKWSPDGTQIAYSISTGGYSQDIYIINVDGTGKLNLTNNNGSANSYRPTWSPEGSRLSFLQNPGSVYLINVNGTGKINITESITNGAGVPSWSPIPGSVSIVD
jgi:Tol biopolymer transport system component